MVDELPALIAENFPADMSRQGVFGHSMGGHGALTMAFKNPERFRSCSAFSPIVQPIDQRLVAPGAGKDTSGRMRRPGAPMTRPR